MQVSPQTRPDPTDETQAACPEPLAWQEVVRRFREESMPWTVARGGNELSGRSWGEGPPLYLLCGIGGSLELYALFVWLLREQFRCVLWDYPGNVPANGRPQRLTCTDLVSDLWAIADAHGDEAFSLYATSFGTVVGLSAMLDAPPRIERAVLQGGFAHRSLSRFERLMIRACCHAPGVMRQFPGRNLVQRQNHRVWFPPFDTSRWQFLVDDTGKIPIAAVAQRAALLDGLDLRPALDRIHQPVLLVRSEGEGVVSEQCHEELAAGLPHARTEFLHSCGHLPYLTHPHRIAKTVRAFLLDEPSLKIDDACPTLGDVVAAPASDCADRRCL